MSNHDKAVDRAHYLYERGYVPRDIDLDVLIAKIKKYLDESEVDNFEDGVTNSTKNVYGMK